MKKIGCVLLVDDDVTTNFYNEYEIQKSALFDSVEVTHNGKEAIDYIKRAVESGVGIPDVILLDVNMPVMNGFEFLESYSQFDLKNNLVIVMLTTSMHNDDIESAGLSRLIDAYMEKPLNIEKLVKLVTEKLIHENTEEL